MPLSQPTLTNRRRTVVGSVMAEFVVVMALLVVVLVVVLLSLERVRDYHTRSSTAMELPL